MKYLIINCNKENNWLSTSVNVYGLVNNYTVLKDSLTIEQLSGQEIFNDFQNTINYYLNQASGEWSINQLIVKQESSYDITHQEAYSEEIQITGEDGLVENQTISGFNTVIDETVPILNIRISDTSETINHSERFYFNSSNGLPNEVEKSVTNIWNTLTNN